MSTHTKEPWTIGAENNLRVIRDSENTTVAIVPVVGGGMSAVKIANLVHMRIVSCVNACTGIENPAAIPDVVNRLEGTIAGMKAAIEKANAAEAVVYEFAIYAIRHALAALKNA